MYVAEMAVTPSPLGVEFPVKEAAQLAFQQKSYLKTTWKR